MRWYCMPSYSVTLLAGHDYIVKARVDRKFTDNSGESFGEKTIGIAFACAAMSSRPGFALALSVNRLFLIHCSGSSRCCKMSIISRSDGAT